VRLFVFPTGNHPGFAPLASQRAAPQRNAVSDRLDELQRQRALVSQHLAWLDAEIAAETAKRLPVGAITPKPRPPSPIEEISLSQDPHAADSDALIQHYTASIESAEAKTKRGCWTVFVLSLIALVVFVGGWYYLRTL